ncbi:MAG: hypothetical protein ABWY00_08775 [Dongiaceae bacterium]
MSVLKWIFLLAWFVWLSLTCVFQLWHLIQGEAHELEPLSAAVEHVLDAIWGIAPWLSAQFRTLCAALSLLAMFYFLFSASHAVKHGDRNKIAGRSLWCFRLGFWMIVIAALASFPRHIPEWVLPGGWAVIRFDGVAFLVFFGNLCLSAAIGYEIGAWMTKDPPGP